MHLLPLCRGVLIGTAMLLAAGCFSQEKPSWLAAYEPDEETTTTGTTDTNNPADSSSGSVDGTVFPPDITLTDASDTTTPLPDIEEPDTTPCTPNCDDKVCGDDDCGGVCPPGCALHDGTVCGMAGCELADHCESAIAEAIRIHMDSDGEMSTTQVNTTLQQSLSDLDLSGVESCQPAESVWPETVGGDQFLAFSRDGTGEPDEHGVWITAWSYGSDHPDAPCESPIALVELPECTDNVTSCTQVAESYAKSCEQLGEETDVCNDLASSDEDIICSASMMAAVTCVGHCLEGQAIQMARLRVVVPIDTVPLVALIDTDDDHPDVQFDLCAWSCEGKTCGDDGCGGSCGECEGPNTCNDQGSCQCIPDCTDNDCGDDGCGGNCGECNPEQLCEEGTCVAVCVPDCSQSGECGDDGCGTPCAVCEAPETCGYEVCYDPSEGHCSEVDQTTIASDAWLQTLGSAEYGSCMEPATDTAACVSELATQVGISTGCAGCIGDGQACSAEHCSVCSEGPSPECLACNQEHCLEFEACQFGQLCCDATSNPECIDPDVQACVCALDQSCCEIEWGAKCVEIGVESCGNTCETTCGDWVCLGDETPCNCWQDCGSCAFGSSCGDSNEPCQVGECAPALQPVMTSENNGYYLSYLLPLVGQAYETALACLLDQPEDVEHARGCVIEALNGGPLNDSGSNASLLGFGPSSVGCLDCWGDLGVCMTGMGGACDNVCASPVTAGGDCLNCVDQYCAAFQGCSGIDLTPACVPSCAPDQVCGDSGCSVCLSDEGDCLDLTCGACGGDIVCENNTCLPPDLCGNSTCDPLEDTQECPTDCYCGDGVCDLIEEQGIGGFCQVDCDACGDGICSPGEDSMNCANDCFCGDALCDAYEADAGCLDCYCGDGLCLGDETQCSCPDDCGMCEGCCADGVCGSTSEGDGTCDDAGESPCTCPSDCGYCEGCCDGTSCESVDDVANGQCDDGENPCGCPVDCGECGNGTVCTDGACQPGCLAECAGKICGFDGCGNTCGICTEEAQICVYDGASCAALDDHACESSMEDIKETWDGQIDLHEIIHILLENLYDLTLNHCTGQEPPYHPSALGTCAAQQLDQGTPGAPTLLGYGDSTPECQTCWGELGVCMVSNCQTECSANTDDPCLACLSNSCPHFFQCSDLNKAFSTICGDGTCSAPETALSCPQDCTIEGECGDDVCEGGEEAVCPFDCPDLVMCDYDHLCEAGDSPELCPDCYGVTPTCGNGVCDGPWDAYNFCPEECPYCGDGECTDEEKGVCLSDCPEPCCEVQDSAGCGDPDLEDCVCNGPAEDDWCCSNEWDSACIANALAQCGLSCGGECGNGTCDPGENGCSCPGDCPACQGCCDDGICEDGTHDDACGASGSLCKTCTGDKTCTDYACTSCEPSCVEGTCGQADGCGETCGCGSDETCNAGVCVITEGECNPSTAVCQNTSDFKWCNADGQLDSDVLSCSEGDNLQTACFGSACVECGTEHLPVDHACNPYCPEDGDCTNSSPCRVLDNGSVACSDSGGTSVMHGAPCEDQLTCQMGQVCDIDGTHECRRLCFTDNDCVGIENASKCGGVEGTVQVEGLADALRVCGPEEACVPDCDGKACGFGGCGGACGSLSCGSGTLCVAGQCNTVTSACGATDEALKVQYGSVSYDGIILNIAEATWDAALGCQGQVNASEPLWDDTMTDCVAQAVDASDDASGPWLLGYSSVVTTDECLACWGALGTCMVEHCPDECQAFDVDIPEGCQLCVDEHCDFGECSGLEHFVGPCTPECTDKACGDDGCGGSCGTCTDGQVCADDGVCGDPPGGCPTYCAGLLATCGDALDITESSCEELCAQWDPGDASNHEDNDGDDEPDCTGNTHFTHTLHCREHYLELAKKEANDGLPVGGRCQEASPASSTCLDFAIAVTSDYSFVGADTTTPVDDCDEFGNGDCPYLINAETAGITQCEFGEVATSVTVSSSVATDADWTLALVEDTALVGDPYTGELAQGSGSGSTSENTSFDLPHMPGETLSLTATLTPAGCLDDGCKHTKTIAVRADFCPPTLSFVRPATDLSSIRAGILDNVTFRYSGLEEGQPIGLDSSCSGGSSSTGAGLSLGQWEEMERTHTALGSAGEDCLLTLSATDAAGNVTEVTRTAHFIPDDQSPDCKLSTCNNSSNNTCGGFQTTSGCGKPDGVGGVCAPCPVDCAQWFHEHPEFESGWFAIDAPGDNKEIVYCLQGDGLGDGLLDQVGAGWTLLASIANDATQTWNANSSSLWSNVTPISSLQQLSMKDGDYKVGPAMAGVQLTEIGFAHHAVLPTTWLSYAAKAPGDEVSFAQLMSTAPTPNNCDATASYPLVEGKSALSGSVMDFKPELCPDIGTCEDETLEGEPECLCDIHLYLNATDNQGACNACETSAPGSGNQHAVGPSWHVASSNGCGFDRPGRFGGLGPNTAQPGQEFAALGFASALGLNTGLDGTDNTDNYHMRMFVRRAICGNGQVEHGEMCDDGNRVNGDTCSDDCSLEAACDGAQGRVEDYGNSLYAFCDRPVDTGDAGGWETAKTLCAEMGATLARVESPAENLALASFAQDFSTTDAETRFWLGLNRIGDGDTGLDFWWDGAPEDASPLNAEVPDAYFPSTYEPGATPWFVGGFEAIYVETNPAGGPGVGLEGYGHWHVNPASEALPYICEIVRDDP